MGVIAVKRGWKNRKRGCGETAAGVVPAAAIRRINHEEICCAAFPRGVPAALLTACGPKAPDTAEPSDPPSAAASPRRRQRMRRRRAERRSQPPGRPPRAAPRHCGEGTVYVSARAGATGQTLSRWLRSSAGKDTAETFIPDGLDAPMYTVPAAERDSEEIPAATDETRRVRVAADTELLETASSQRGSRRLRPRPDTSPRSMPAMRLFSLPRLPRARPMCC